MTRKREILKRDANFRGGLVTLSALESCDGQKFQLESVVYADVEPAGLLASRRAVNINTSDEQVMTHFVDP